jgi:hypothetical protein
MERYSEFFCIAEWHFSGFKGKGAATAPLIYNFALRLSKKSGVFSVSIPHLAKFFRVDERTVRKAIHLLVDKEFFIELRTEAGAAVTYRPVLHTVWAQTHPGQCTEKMQMPWAADEDPLGVELYAISGQRFKPYPNFVKGMRKTGHSPVAIRSHFVAFVEQDQPTGKQWKNGFAGKFIKYLKEQEVLPSNPSHAVQ